MRSVEDALDSLRVEYEGVINFKRICADKGIVVTKAKLVEGLNALSIAANGHKIIILSELIPTGHRRDWAFHELWHILRSPSYRGLYSGDRREENRANLFAALCRVPVVQDGDTVNDLKERYDVSAEIAKIRLEYALKKTGQR